MDSDLDDILNDGSVAPAAVSAAAPASADAPPQTAAAPSSSPSPSPGSPYVKKAPDGKLTQEPIVEAAPMSTESAVLVSAPDMGEDSKDENALDTTPVPAVTDKSPPASSSTSERSRSRPNLSQVPAASPRKPQSLKQKPPLVVPMMVDGGYLR